VCILRTSNTNTNIYYYYGRFYLQSVGLSVLCSRSTTTHTDTSSGRHSKPLSLAILIDPNSSSDNLSTVSSNTNTILLTLTLHAIYHVLCVWIFYKAVRIHTSGMNSYQRRHGLRLAAITNEREIGWCLLENCLAELRNNIDFYHDTQRRQRYY